MIFQKIKESKHVRVFTAYRDGAYSFLLHRPKQRYKISMIEKKLGPKKNQSKNNHAIFIMVGNKSL
jgi:hypothetical protein